MSDLPTIYHGTPMTPRAARITVLPGRAACVSFFRPDHVRDVEHLCPQIMYDNGAFSFWRQAAKLGHEWDRKTRDWRPYYRWLEGRLHAAPGRWAVIPDAPGAPSQLNDALLNDWPYGPTLGAPLWHMDGPINRLGRLCETYDRVCLGWVGDPKREPVGCDAYRRRMDEVAALLGDTWPTIHMMRGVAVARDYPFRVRRQHVARPKRAPLRPRSAQRRPTMVRPATLRKQAGGPGNGNAKRHVA